MNRFALLAAAALVTVAVLSSPPAHAQAKCGSDLCMGSNGTQVHLKGNLLVDKPVVPGTSSGILIDGGVGINGVLTIQGALGATASNDDGGTVSLHVNGGYTTCASGRAAVTFTRAFSAVPICTCNSVTDGGCDLEGPASSTAVVLHCQTASQPATWMCIGPR